VVSLDNVVVLRTIWEARRRNVVSRIRMAWAPGEVIKRHGTGLGLDGTCREAHTSHREAARQERPSNGLIQGVGIVHGGRLMPAACEILASAADVRRVVVRRRVGGGVGWVVLWLDWFGGVGVLGGCAGVLR
jgi:hypothetical protein